MLSVPQIETIIKKERSRLFNFIRTRVSSTEDAEDILQDVLYRLMEHLPDFGTIENVTSWLFASTRNRIVDTYRKHHTETFSDTESSADDDGDVIKLADILPDTRELPDQELINHAIWEAVENALDELPDEQREAFVLHEFEGYSFNEIASMLDVPLNTLLSRKRYALLHLRMRLRELYR
jgi:RNA polymerase sigma factor (sigma-70 family)